jgi:hypothetical protein
MEVDKVPPTVSEHSSYTEINMSQIRVGGGVAGLIFALGTVYIFVAGVPAVRAFFVWSLVAGAVISIALHLLHRYKPARPAGSDLDLSSTVTPPPNLNNPVAKGRINRPAHRTRWGGLFRPQPRFTRVVGGWENLINPATQPCVF